jgi:hypothetical protein
MNYYYLIASLPELSIEDPLPNIDVSDTLGFIFRNLDEGDQRLGKYLVFPNDNQNLINTILEEYHQIPGLDFNALSIYNNEAIRQALRKESDLPDYMTSYLNTYKDKLDLLRPARVEEFLWIEFYNEVAALDNTFIYEYFLLDKILRQLAAIRNSRLYEVSLISEFINDKINRELGLSRPKSVISKSYPYVGELWNALNKQDPYVIEKSMDMIRWEFIDNYDPLLNFSSARVFGWIVKLTIYSRWLGLSKEKGKNRFEEVCSQALLASKISELEKL